MTSNLENRVFRSVAERLGAHWHVAVFSARSKDHTFAKLGNLVMDDHDYQWFTALLACEHIQKEAA